MKDHKKQLRERLAIAGRIIDPVKRQAAIDRIKQREEVAANQRRLDRRDNR